MRIAFIQRDAYEKMGVHQLLGALKGHGHQIDLFIHELETSFYETIVKFQPDFLLYSLYIEEESFMLEAFSEIKRRLPTIKTLVGGPFTLVFPDIVSKPQVDYIIRGDGEIALPLFLQSWSEPDSYQKIPGLGFMKPNGKIFLHPEVNIVENLCNIPEPQRDPYYKYQALKERDTKIFIASRGCPFNCSYCYNAELKKKFRGRYWRKRSPESVFREIENIRDRYGLKWVQFQDGTFNADPAWVKSFLNGYRDRCLPKFLCNCRVENFDEELTSLLRESGCDRITFGVQSGNQHIRAKLARRPMTDEQILNAFDLCRKYGIRTGADIIFGWPGETVAQAMETIRFCRKLDADSYHSNVLIPYPGLSLTRNAVAQGYMEREPTLAEIADMTANRSLICQENIQVLINMDKLYYYLIRFPRAENLLKHLLRIPPNRVFNTVKNLHLLGRSLKYDAKGPASSLNLIRRHLRFYWHGASYSG